MFYSRRRFLLAGSLALISPLGYWAWKAHGRGGAGAEEPLPPGAIARLRPGSSRLEGGPTCLAFSPDGKTLAGGFADGTLAVWKVADGAESLRRQVTQQQLDAIVFSSGGEVLAALDSSGAVHFWKTATGEVISRPPDPPPASPPREVREGDAVPTLTPDDQAAVPTLTPDVQAASWIFATGMGRVTRGAIAFSDEGKTLVSAGLGNTVRFWEAATGKPLRQQPLQGTEKRPPEAGYWTWSALSADGRILATASGGGWGLWDECNLAGTSVWLWEAATGKCLQQLEGPAPFLTQHGFVFG